MNMKRVLSFVMAFVMVLGLLPAASAAEGTVLDLGVNGLTVTHSAAVKFDHYEGKLTTNTAVGNASATWVASGTSIDANAKWSGVNYVGSTLTLKNTSGADATLEFTYSVTSGTVWINGQVAAAEGSVEVSLKNNEAVTVQIASATYHVEDMVWDPENASLTISGISLDKGGDKSVTFRPVENGSYTVNNEALTVEQSITATSGTPYLLAATPAEGYQFFGWYNATIGEYISYDASVTLRVTDDWTVYPVFLTTETAIFAVGSTKFDDLNKADAFAQGGDIVLMNDGILPAGEYTISAGNTLLIPYDDSNSLHTTATSIAVQNGNVWENKEWETPRAYRTLTMAQGAKITVQGSLNVGGRHSAGPFLTAGSPSGDLGMIQMAEGAKITVANGGTLYCWGYIYGDGTVTVKDGGEAHENFQFSDFRGGNITLGLATSFLVFPISQYYVQNIEVAATFEHGATEYVWGSVYLQGEVLSTSVKFIGTNEIIGGANVPCMFIPEEGSSVTKTYDPSTDRLVIDVNGDGSINPMGLSLGGTTIDTATFVLPINSNMTININSGITHLNQSLALLPGVKLTIAEHATLSLKSREPLRDENKNIVHYKGGNNLIVYDRDQWWNAYQPIKVDGKLVGANYVEAKFVYAKDGFKRLQPVAWSPTRTYSRTEADLVDAVVDINGKLVTEGFIYTTVDLNLKKYLSGDGLEITGGGAAVTSSKKTGILVMASGMGRDNITLQPHPNTETVEFAYLPMLSARLLNADGTYTDTIGATAGTTYNYCAACETWQLNPHNAVDITWIVDGDSQTQEFCKGTKPVYGIGNDPVKEGYKFIGWSTGNDNVPEYTAENLPNADTDATYWACFVSTLKGDLDLDGDVDAEDLTLLAKHVGKIKYLTGQALANANVDDIGEVDANDLTKIARYISGIITDWSQE